MKTCAFLAALSFALPLPAQLARPITWIFHEDTTAPTCPSQQGTPHFLPDHAIGQLPCWSLPCPTVTPTVTCLNGSASLVWEGFDSRLPMMLAIGTTPPATPWFPCVSVYPDVGILCGFFGVDGLVGITLQLPTMALPSLPWGRSTVGWGQAVQLDMARPISTWVSSYAFTIEMQI